MFKFILLVGIGLCSLQNTASAETQVIAYELNTSFLEERGQLRQVKFFGEDLSIRLNDMELVEDDAPGIGMPEGATDRSWFERLHKGVRIRKELVLDDPRTFEGFLLFNGLEMEDNDTPLNIMINGHHFVRPPTKLAHPFAKQYYTREWGANFDNWFFVKIPAGALRKGNNELILWADSEETSWEIMIAAGQEFFRGSETRQKHPGRSAKSSDGGSTWNSSIGWKDEYEGEYTIRLSLDRFVPQGEYVSPVIDLAEKHGIEGVKRLVKIKESRIGWMIETPDDTFADIYISVSDSPVESSGSWTEWEKVNGMNTRIVNPEGRFCRFKVVMKTEDPLVTPVFRGVEIETELEFSTPTSPMMYRVVDFQNGKVIRPSVEFTHEDFEKLSKYRETFELDKVVEGARTEFEAQLKLMRWAYQIPIKGVDRYNWNYYDLPVLNRDSDGNIVLQELKGRRRHGHCLYCNLTLMGAFLSMGYPTRWVNIATRTTYGHEVVEVWSNDFNKWIFMDATRDYYIYDPETGIPLNLIEINERLKKIMPGVPDWEFPIKWMVPNSSLALDVDVAYREGENSFSINEMNQGPHLLLLKGQLHIPLRNDFASRPHPVPWRISSNWGGPLFYGYYNEVFPRKREYSLHTNRPVDFNYPLNQSELTVSETGKPGVLRVDIDTHTPYFETYVVSFDSGGWEEVSGSSFLWELAEGLNTVRVRTRNTAGISGPESSIRIVMNR